LRSNGFWRGPWGERWWKMSSAPQSLKFLQLKAILNKEPNTNKYLDCR
jgi:hypothetical protein